MAEGLKQAQKQASKFNPDYYEKMIQADKHGNMTDEQVKQLFYKLQKPEELDSENELFAGGTSLKFDDILNGMGINDIISGSESEEERKGPKFYRATNLNDILTQKKLPEEEEDDEAQSMAKVQSNLLKAYDQHQQKAKGIPDLSSKSAAAAMQSDTDSDAAPAAVFDDGLDNFGKKKNKEEIKQEEIIKQ